MRIGVDIDDVLAECRFVEYYNERYGTAFDPETFPQYSYFRGESKEEWLRVIDEFYKSGHFSTMTPVPGSREGIHLLREAGYSLSAITSRTEGIKDVTCKWINEHFGDAFGEIDFAGEYLGIDKITKEDLCRKHSIDVLIDDASFHATGCASIGVTVLLYDQPWNREVEESERIRRVYNWEEIVKEIENHDKR